MTVSKPLDKATNGHLGYRMFRMTSANTFVKAAWRRNGYNLYFPQEEVQVQVQLNIEQDAQLDDKVDISDYNNLSADETLTDTTSEAPNNNNE